MRLFVAVAIDPELQSSLARALAPWHALAPRARWVAPESFHITLQFIGLWPAEGESALRGELAAVAAPGFRLRLAGLGAFPDSRRPRQLWAGVADPEPIAALAAGVEQACRRLGVAPEARAYTPHLTLARAPRGDALRAAAEASATGRSDWGTQMVRAFHLFQSETRPQGAVYTRRASFPLGPAAA